MIDNITPAVRIRNEPVSFSDPSPNVFVEQLIDGEWRVWWGSNELSNNYAYSEAKAQARALAKEAA